MKVPHVTVDRDDFRGGTVTGFALADGHRTLGGGPMTLQSELRSETAKPMLFDRRRQMLALLDALGGRAGNLDFHAAASAWNLRRPSESYQP